MADRNPPPPATRSPPEIERPEVDELADMPTNPGVALSSIVDPKTLGPEPVKVADAEKMHEYMTRKRREDAEATRRAIQEKADQAEAELAKLRAENAAQAKTQAATQAAQKAETDSLVRTIRNIGIAIGMVAGAVVAALIWVDGRIEKIAGETARAQETRLTNLELAVVRLAGDQNSDHSLILGVSQKLDVQLRAMGIPNPAPTPKDAGQ